MGRHGGGSHSGGGGGHSGGSGGSRGGSSGSRSSNRPFSGCYNRSWYDRRGRYHPYYTSNPYYGTRRGGGIVNIFALLFVTVHMCFMVGGFAQGTVFFGSKVSGDPDRIQVIDNAQMLSQSDEASILRIFQRVYNESGMPITLYTDDSNWEQYYNSIESYSEDLYYQQGLEEDAMIILFCIENKGEFYDWHYDMYCGDDTIRCLSDASFEKLLDNFQKSMYQEDLAKALDYAWNSVINELATISINWGKTPVLLTLLAVYGIFYYAILGGMLKERAARRYFEENPHKFSMDRMSGESGTHNYIDF